MTVKSDESSLVWFGAMLTKDNMLDIAQYCRMIKTMTGEETTPNIAIQHLIRMGADAYIREC